MASVDTSTNNPNDPNNPNNTPGAVNQPGQQVNQPATTGGAGGVTATGAGNVTGQVVGTANPSQPFQNISSYLAANAPQSKDLANQVAGTVTAPITEAQTGITNAANTFTGAVNAGYTPENKDLTTAVSQNPAFVVGENPDNVTNFMGQLNDKYTGPTDFTQAPGYADLQAKIAAAQAKAGNTQNEAGIQTLLRDVEGPTTAGVNKLDSLLLSANPENAKTIQNAGAGATALLPTLNQTAADQNALAAQGTTNASASAQAARDALQTAISGESGNLTNEQNTVQGVVNEYNQSVGVINPVVSAISSAINDFLAANPNVKPLSGPDPMAALQNLTSIVMPGLASYASPEDYAQIAALTQLGGDVSGLPIGSATANEAQSFNVPTALQNAIGQAPGVESALQNELTGFGNEINSAVQPYQDLQTKEMARADLVNQADQLQPQLKQAQVALANNPNDPALQKTVTDLQAKITAITSDPNYAIQNYWPELGRMAQGLQWVNGTETSYQQLVDAINAQLGKLGTVGVPTLTYGPNSVTDPVTGAPLGKVAAQDIGKAANAAALGATAAAGIGSGLAEAGGAAGSGLAAGTTGESIAAGLQGAGEVAGPAALAAYGTSNIAQNEAADPIRGGLETFANMGLTLATMSLPPQIFNSIGKDINSVFNDIGSFFGNLF